MTTPGHRNEQTGGAGLDRIQANVRAFIASLRLVPFLFGGKLVSVTFTAGGAQKIVRHGLGVAAACFPIRWNYHAAAAMNGPTFAEWVPQPTTVDPRESLALVASAACTVDLWFYPRASKTIDANLGQSP